MGDVDKHELVLVHDAAEPEHNGGANRDERRDGCKNQADDTHEQQVRVVDGVLELGRLRPLADVTRRTTKDVCADGDPDQVDDLRQIEDGQEAAQREESQLWAKH